MDLRRVALVALCLGLGPTASARADLRQVDRGLDAARAPRAQLAAPTVRVTRHASYTTAQQRVDGRPVLGATVTVTDAAGSRGDLVLDRTRAGIGTPPKPTVSRAAAIAAARRGLPGRLRAAPTASLALRPEVRGARLVWVVRLALSGPHRRVETLVDARTGTVVSRRRLDHTAFTATGNARLFDPNPLVNPGGAFTDGGDADTAALTAARVPVTLARLSDADSCLDGQWVDARIKNAKVCLAGRDFSAVTRHNQQFEALMGYFHLDRAATFLSGLGLTPALPPQLRFKADNFPDDNSDYDSDAKLIETGTGGVDDAEDADILVHEYGHAVQDHEVDGFGGSEATYSIGEGFGDYLSSTVMDHFSSPPGHGVPCLGEWDSISYNVTGCLRRVDGTRSLPELKSDPVCDADEHCLGQAWSGLLWSLRGQLGAGVVDRLAVTANLSIPLAGTWEDAARALVAADGALFASVHRDAIAAALGRYGVIDPERIDDVPSGAAILAVPGTRSGTLGAGGDAHDLYAVRLTAGHGVRFALSGATGAVALRLLPPGTTDVDGAAVAAGSGAFSHVPDQTGTYVLDVGDGGEASPYTVTAALDTDGDGRPDASDICPSVVDTGADTDHDGLGDACDPTPTGPPPPAKTTTTTTPTTTAPTPVSPSPHLDRTAPKLVLAGYAPRSTALGFRLRASERARAAVRVVLSARTAKRLGLVRKARELTLVLRTTTLAAHRTKTLRLAFSERVTRALRAHPRTRITLRLYVRDAAGNARRAKRVLVVLRRR